MKYLVCLILVLLTGCTSTNGSSYMGKSKLDIAPKSDLDVLYPEWGRIAKLETNSQTSQGQIAAIPEKQGVAQSRVRALADTSESLKGLMNYFSRNNIRYELIPGKHAMIRLLQPIYFEVDSMRMTDQSRDFLDNIARYITNYRQIEMVIEGHTDNSGSSAHNDALSIKRAEAVEQWILSRFTNLKKIYVRGYGSAIPVCSNNSKNGKACNRRVEVFFILPS